MPPNPSLLSLANLLTPSTAANPLHTLEFVSLSNPTQVLSYTVVLLDGAIEHWQMGPSGMGVILTVGAGALYVVILDPGDCALFLMRLEELLSALSTRGDSSMPFNSKFESLVVEARNRMCIPILFSGLNMSSNFAP